MRRFASRLIALLITCYCVNAYAGGPCSGVRGGCHRSSYRDSARSSAPSIESVHVDGYFRKDGTYVRPHNRRPPGTVSHSDNSSFSLPDLPTDEKPTRKYRTSARTKARDSIWKGTGSTADDDDAKAPAAKPSLPAKYIVHLTSGRKFEIADYRDDTTSYWITLRNGGGMRYSKPMVSKIDPIEQQ